MLALRALIPYATQHAGCVERHAQHVTSHAVDKRIPTTEKPAQHHSSETHAKTSLKQLRSNVTATFASFITPCRHDT